MGCWKKAAAAARAIAAAMPLQANAKQVLLAGAKGRHRSLGDGLADLSSQPVWHGISVKIDFHAVGCGSGGRSVDGGCPGASRRHAGHGCLWSPPYAQIVFGGFTQSVLESAETPVFLTH